MKLQPIELLSKKTDQVRFIDLPLLVSLLKYHELLALAGESQLDWTVTVTTLRHDVALTQPPPGRAAASGAGQAGSRAVCGWKIRARIPWSVPDGEAIVPPHGAQCLSEMGGEQGRIHQGRGLQPVAQPGT